MSETSDALLSLDTLSISSSVTPNPAALSASTIFTGGKRTADVLPSAVTLTSLPLYTVTFISEVTFVLWAGTVT